MDTSKVTRFEIIDHTPCETCNGKGWNGEVEVDGITRNLECIECHGVGMPGREVVAWSKDLQFDVELQDDGRTLKVFIHQRYEGVENE